MPSDQAALANVLGIEELPAEVQQELIAGFSAVAIKAALGAIVEKIPEGKREEFATLSEAGDARALQGFLDREVPGHEALAAEAVRRELTTFKEATTA